MRRISTPTAAQDLFGPGKHGFRNGDPANAILATRLQAEWFNALQEEVCSVIEQAGLPLDTADNTQLAAAIVQLIESNTIDSLNTARVDVASAAMVNLTTAAPDTRHINITGTTNITGFTVAVGRCYFVRFAGSLLLTNSVNLVTQTGANVRTAAGDTCILRATAGGVVELLNYSYVNPLRRSSQNAITLGGLITVPHGLGYQPDTTDFDIELVNATAEFGWTPGQTPKFGISFFSQSFPNGDGMIAWADATNIYIQVGNSGVPMVKRTGTVGQVDRVTPASWRVVAVWKRSV